MSRSSGLQTIDRVHIAPMGYERDRILLPATRYDADLVYLLIDVRGAAAPTYHDEVVAELEAAGVDVRSERVDLHDIYEVMGRTTTLAARHADDEVLVNISSGTNTAAVGAAIACMTTAATAYSVEPGEYVPDVSREPVTRGVAAVEELPDYPIESPTRDQIAVMEYVYETEEKGHTVHKRDLIAFAEEADLAFMTDPPTENRQSKYRRLSSAVVDPLTEKGYIEVREAGRRKLVSLTDIGRSVYFAFEHKLRYD